MNKKQAVNKFIEVRDTPYRIPLSIKENNNSCSGKHVLLKKLLEELGYQVRYRVCAYRWSNLSLPPSLVSIPHEDNSTHVYIEVQIGKIWKIVDATWDKKLAPTFQINNWDGEADTQIAVPFVKIFSVEESTEIMKSDDDKAIEADLNINRDFYGGFNDWLESLRSHLETSVDNKEEK